LDWYIYWAQGRCVEHEAFCRCFQSCNWERRFYGVRLSLSLHQAISILIFRMTFRKIWDTFSGAALHSFPHNHIVRSVAFSPSASHLLTGGQEKKVRVFDLRRPDAEPEFLGGAGAGTAHEGTVKSVVWINESNCVTAGEDGAVKYVPSWTVSLR
jgi:WD40 repeat protein